MAQAKILNPPLIWNINTRSLEVDKRYKPWDKNKIRAMKNGTYDWKKHEEVNA